jgi:hypothetical protein
MFEERNSCRDKFCDKVAPRRQGTIAIGYHAWCIPPTRPKYHPLWARDRVIEPPIFQEPFRIVGLGFGVDRLIVAHRPTHRTQINHSDISQRNRCSPDISNNIYTGGNETPFVNIVSRSLLRDPERQRASPPQQFLQQGGDVWQIFPV